MISFSIKRLNLNKSDNKKEIEKDKTILLISNDPTESVQ